MCDTLEQYTKDGTFGKSWKNRFRDKWPTMTTLMHQSEITVEPYIHEYTDPHEIMAYQTCKIPDWDGSSQTSWSVARSIEQDILESNVTSSPGAAKKRRCEKVCRNVLCAFLILSVVMAVVAAIGLSVFLKLHDHGFAEHHGHHHGKPFLNVDVPNVEKLKKRNHIHANITTEEEVYLSNIFCSLVKRLLTNTGFPVERGLENCHTVLLFIENSQDLHIEMHVSPRDGYTIKEKIVRALTERVLKDTKNRVRYKGIQTTVSANEMKTEHSTLPVISVKDSTSVSGQQLLTEYQDIDSNKTFDRNGEKQQIVVQETSTKNDDAVTYSNNDVVNEQIISTTQESIAFNESLYSSTASQTTLPPIILPQWTAPVLTVNGTNIFQYETSTNLADVTTSLDGLAGTSGMPTTTSRQFDESTTLIQESTSQYTGLKSTEGQTDKLPWQKTPIATKLFNPRPVDITNTFVNENINTEVQNKSRNKSPKIVESLMAGGVMKLPFKTNSNFRFLFSSDSKAKKTKQNVFKKPEVIVKTTYTKAITGGKSLNEADTNYKANFNSPINKISVSKASDLFTEKPASPDLFRTIRIPTSSTKSFRQRKTELPRNPKRTIDVTEFGDQSLVFS